MFDLCDCVNLSANATLSGEKQGEIFYPAKSKRVMFAVDSDRPGCDTLNFTFPKSPYIMASHPSMISVSLSKTLEPQFQRHFAEIEPASFSDWTSILTTSVWSPILWRGGCRLKAAFLSCAYIVLDCDNGEFKLSEAVEWCRDLNLSHIIGVTKSHGIEKVSRSGKREPACDRFRMILRASYAMTNRELYEYNMGLMAEYFAADISCKDAGRFFYPCREIVSTGLGETVAWRQEYDADYIPENDRYEMRRERLKQYSKGCLPHWIRGILMGAETIAVGERHKTCYRLGAWLGVIGFSVDEIVEMLCKTTLGDIGRSDVYRAVENGYRAEGLI